MSFLYLILLSFCTILFPSTSFFFFPFSLFPFPPFVSLLFLFFFFFFLLQKYPGAPAAPKAPPPLDPPLTFGAQAGVFFCTERFGYFFKFLYDSKNGSISGEGVYPHSIPPIYRAEIMASATCTQNIGPIMTRLKMAKTKHIAYPLYFVSPRDRQ